LTITLAGATPSRRRMLRSLAGGALAAVFGGKAFQAAAQEVGTLGDAVCEGQQVICNTAGAPGFKCAEGCVCARNVSGEKQCVNGLGDTCRNRKRCERNRDCNRAGQVCIRVRGCTGSACATRSRGLCYDRCQVT